MGLSGLTPLVRGPDWIVVAKPSGLACHRSALVHDRDTVMSRARRRYGPEVRLVHRLDRSASGCLLLGVGADATARLQAAQTGREATKVYVALVRGVFRWTDPVDVTTPIASEGGDPRPARTTVMVLGTSAEPRCSLVVARPETGRNHQVRRHLRDLGHPILGDHKHGDTRVNRTWRETTGLQRLQLHALSVDVPVEGVSAWCPLPHELADLWRSLPCWSGAAARQPRLTLGPAPGTGAK